MNTKTLRLSSSEKISFISNFATMLSAGIPILEVVNSLLEDARGNQKRILEELKADLIQGHHIYTTLGKFPSVFDKVTVSVVKASEEAGTLDITLKDVRQNIQKEIEFSDKVKTALLYPLFIVIVFFGVLFVILVMVIPKIASVFSRLNVTLPLSTRFLIFLSDLLLKQTIPVIGALVIVVLGAILLYRRKRSVIFQLFSSLPFISGLVKQIDLTRFSRSLYLLLSAGLPIMTALELVEDVVVKRQTARIIRQSREHVLSGKTLTEGFRSSKGYIPTLMVKLIEAGEKTGTLDKSMQDISEYFDYHVTNTLKTFTSLLEPILLVAVALVIGGMMLSIIAPIYGLIGQVGTR